MTFGKFTWNQFRESNRTIKMIVRWSLVAQRCLYWKWWEWRSRPKNEEKEKKTSAYLLSFSPNKYKKYSLRYLWCSVGYRKHQRHILRWFYAKIVTLKEIIPTEEINFVGFCFWNFKIFSFVFSLTIFQKWSSIFEKVRMEFRLREWVSFYILLSL